MNNKMDNEYKSKPHLTKKHVLQQNNKESNPCYQEHKMSLKCLGDNNYDAESCQLYFQNYKNCNEFWNAVHRHRRNNGIFPLLPPYEERQEIKARYLETGIF